MKSRDTLIRLKKFQVDEKRRQVAQIEMMLAEFQRMLSDLDKEIETEQSRTGINDPGHFAYSTYAKAAMVRRENIKASSDDLQSQLDHAKSALADAFEELKKVEILDEREDKRDRLMMGRRDQMEMDRVAQSSRSSLLTA
jgi:flagellar protein FliJ